MKVADGLTFFFDALAYAAAVALLIVFARGVRELSEARWLLSAVFWFGAVAFGLFYGLKRGCLKRKNARRLTLLGLSATRFLLMCMAVSAEYATYCICAGNACYAIGMVFYASCAATGCAAAATAYGYKTEK